MEALTYSYPVWLYLVVAADWDKPCVCPKKKTQDTYVKIAKFL